MGKPSHVKKSIWYSEAHRKVGSAVEDPKHHPQISSRERKVRTDSSRAKGKPGITCPPTQLTTQNMQEHATVATGAHMLWFTREQSQQKLPEIERF